MSAISGSTSLQSLFSNLRQATATSASSRATKAVSNSSGASAPSTAAASTVRGHRHHRGAGGGLRSQIESAVQKALSDAAPSDDVDDTIQKAIEGVLKQGQFSSTAGASSNAPTNAASGTSNISAKPSEPFFNAFLAAHGVNAQRFASDLRAAFKTALSAGTAADTASAFSKLPGGSEIDVSA